MRQLRALPIAWLAAVVAAAPAAADRKIGDLARTSPVRAWGDLAVLSVYDAHADRYRLAISVRDGVPRPLPNVAPSTAPFEADIGPDSRARPLVVYARCARGRDDVRGTQPSTCDLYRYSLETHDPRPIRAANDREADETAPTVWGDRIAWARRYSKHANPVIYTRRLDAPRGVRSRRLPGLPTERCGSVGPCPQRTSDGYVSDLELWGRHLALNVTYFYPNIDGICGEREVRLDDVGGRVRPAVVAQTICGLSGQTYVGPSFGGGYLLFALSCPGDPGGCRGEAVTFRYNLDRRVSERGRTQNAEIVGFAARSSRAALEVTAPATNSGTCDDHVATGPPPLCELTAVDTLGY